MPTHLARCPLLHWYYQCLLPTISAASVAAASVAAAITAAIAAAFAAASISASVAAASVAAAIAAAAEPAAAALTAAALAAAKSTTIASAPGSATATVGAVYPLLCRNGLRGFPAQQSAHSRIQRNARSTVLHARSLSARSLSAPLP